MSTSSAPRAPTSGPPRAAHVVAEPSHDLPMVGLTVSLVAGAVHEPIERAGLARLTARMLRRGGAGLTAEQIDERLDELGAELGVAVGLGTTTVQVESLRRSLEPVTDLVCALLAEPSFPVEELDRLRRQSVSEIIESRDNDGLLAGRALRRQLFAGHPHARRVTGSIGSLEAITQADLIAYHRRFYGRDNAIIGIWGDLQPAEVDQLAARLSASLPSVEPTRYDVPEHALEPGRRLVIVDKPARQQTQLLLGTLGTHPLDDDHVALLVANTALGGTFSSRLVQEIRAKRGWSYGASSQLSAGRIREIFSLWAAPSATDAPACLALELEMLDEWWREGISAEELEFCKSYMTRSFAFDVDTPRKRVGQGIERALLGLPEDFHARFVERVHAVTREQANAAVRRRIDPSALWISVVGTAGELGPQLAGAAGELADTVVAPFDLE